MEAIGQLKGAEIRAISDSSIILIHRPLTETKTHFPGDNTAQYQYYEIDEIVVDVGCIQLISPISI